MKKEQISRNEKAEAAVKIIEEINENRKKANNNRYSKRLKRTTSKRSRQKGIEELEKEI